MIYLSLRELLSHLPKDHHVRHVSIDLERALSASQPQFEGGRAQASYAPASGDRIPFRVIEWDYIVEKGYQHINDRYLGYDRFSDDGLLANAEYRARFEWLSYGELYLYLTIIDLLNDLPDEVSQSCMHAWDLSEPKDQEAYDTLLHATFTYSKGLQVNGMRLRTLFSSAISSYTDESRYYSHALAPHCRITTVLPSLMSTLLNLHDQSTMRLQRMDEGQTCRTIAGLEGLSTLIETLRTNELSQRVASYNRDTFLAITDFEEKGVQQCNAVLSIENVSWNRD